jgi:hypothetical protein
LSACAPDAPAPPSEPSPTIHADAPWFLCDALNRPRVLVARKSADGARTLITEYEKPGGAPVLRLEYEIADMRHDAGEVETLLMTEGAPPGRVRALAPEASATGLAAFTPPIRTLIVGDRDFQCRWLPRTRLIGFSETATYVVHEDADGDLLYTAYDASLEPARIIELSDNARTTPFSAEARDGREITGPAGSEFRFETEDMLYLVVAPTEGPASVEIWRGDEQLLSQTLIAQQLGTGAVE